ncbi:hypothetical protein AMS68_003962 [Peltaster fructicola]|uniref:RFX-type winged-helix domain-containing protein n=1 Tax=Peltaster fructicola TaxID=286661 RepID=A0A6H0XUW3_9PEZI|nr:hypothetical protein AMS68_003962 [Peltaster fructicola]
MQRPDSRASTTSATSQLDFDHDVKQNPALYLQGGPEAALLQYHVNLDANAQFMTHDDNHALQAPPGHFPMQGYGSQDSSYLQEMPYTHNMRVGSVPIQPGPDLHDDKRRKSSAVTATNDKELREMLNRNENRPLREVAQEVIQKERTPQAEKTKQLFAMLWLRAVCKPAKTSVPRNRVYSQYADRCGTERVVPLNPASFGKLVRVIFPGIQTRRLGVRGESKYHYVDLALEDENAQATTNGTTTQDSSRSRRDTSASAQNLDFNNVPRLQADTAAFPTADTFDIPPPKMATPRGPASSSRIFAWPEPREMTAGTLEAETYSQTLRFPSRNEPIFTENEPVVLPPIHPYLPPRTDPDTVDALCALYRTHCTSLIDSIRFCKEKQFFRLYESFNGTLTVPVQKLFTNSNLAPWIEQCDLVMYRTMVRFVSRLTLQAAPVVVINIMNNISRGLHIHIAKTFAAQPAHVLEAKLRPAAIFASLLYRLIRVNQSAHAAANLLTIDHNREIMWNEWQKMVNPKRVMEAELPADCPYEEVHQILTKDIRALLEPLPMDSFSDSPYGFPAYNIEENGGFANYMQSQMNSRPTTAGDIASGVSSETILDRWSEFICSLPARFPKAEARTLLHCVSAIGTASLRDITIMNGQSYGHWWVLKIFVDEMTLWLAEMGGFLETEQTANTAMVPEAEDARNYNQSPPLSHDGPQYDRTQSSNSSGIGSRMSSTVPAEQSAFQAPGNMNNMFQNSMPYQNGVTMNGAGMHNLQDFSDRNMSNKSFRPQEADLDDSGIVMDDDMSVSKYANLGRHANELGMIV